MNFRFIRSTFPAAAYGVHISQIIGYSRACGSYQDVLDRGCANTEAIETMVPFGNEGVITSKM